MQTELMGRIVSEYLQSDRAKEVIEKAVDETFKKTIADLVGGYNSVLKKQLDAAIAKALQVSGEIQIASYNDAILKVIERQVRTGTERAIEKQVAERMKQLLTPAPEKIRLSALLEQYREHLAERYRSGCTCHGDESFHLVITNDRGEFVHVKLWEEKPTANASGPDINFGVYRGTIYTLSFRNQQLEKQLFVGPFYDFEKSLFQMQAAKTEIELDVSDPDDVNRHYGHSD